MKILFFCAHPDDLEFFLGHFISALANPTLISPNLRPHLGDSPKFSPDNIQIQIASMTRGEYSYFTDKVKSTRKAAETRTKELQSSCKIMGVPPPEFLGFLDGHIQTDQQSVNLIKSYLREESADIVVVPEPVFTFYHHPDHIRTGKIAYFAIKQMIKERRNKSGKKSQDSPMIIPSLYYYGALINQYYFPKFPPLETIVNNAIKAHYSQRELLKKNQIPGEIMGKINGRRLPGYKYGEALRKQDFSPSYQHNTLEFTYPLWKRVIYFVSKKYLSSYSVAKRTKYFDGMLEPDF